MALAELKLLDDLEIAQDHNTYADQTDPPPPLPGVYRFKVTSPLSYATAFGTDTPIVLDGMFPTLQLRKFKIVEPDDAVREFQMMHNIETKPKARFGETVSDLQDILRALDQTRQWSKRSEGTELLEELIASETFVAQLSWKATDMDYVEEAFKSFNTTLEAERGQSTKKLTQEQANRIWKEARLGPKNFLPNGRGGRLAKAIGPSGAELKAKPYFQKFIPSLMPAKLGAWVVK